MAGQLQLTGEPPDVATAEGSPPVAVRTIADLMRFRARRSGTRLAVVDGDLTLSYAEVYAAARCRAAALAARGIRRGDRVAILLPRSADALACLLATQLLAAVAVPINDRLRTRQVEHVLTDSAASLLITGQRLAWLAEGAKAAGCALADVAELADEPGTEPPPCRCAPQDLALLVYTSGSTGLAKGVMTSQANLAAGTESVATYTRLRPDDRVLSVLPWSVDYGLNQVLSAFWAGATVVIERSAFGPDICRSLREHRITGLAGVPALWKLLADRPSTFLTRPLPGLRYVTNSGEKLGRRMLEDIRRVHPHVDVYLMYGLTEAFRSTYLDPRLVDTHPTSIGQPIPGTEAMVLDEQGRPCGADEVGEFVEAGSTVALGYWRNPAATAEVYRPDPRGGPDHAGERVVYSGDLVKRSAEGLLYYVGRRDQQVKIQGMKVSPAEVELVLADSGLVSQAVAFTHHDDQGRVRLVAVVVPAHRPTFSLGALHEHCLRELPTYLQPGTIVVRDEMPQTSWQKVDRGRVRSEYLASAGLT